MRLLCVDHIVDPAVDPAVDHTMDRTVCSARQQQPIAAVRYLRRRRYIAC